MKEIHLPTPPEARVSCWLWGSLLLSHCLSLHREPDPEADPKIHDCVTNLSLKFVLNDDSEETRTLLTALRVD